MSSQYFGFEDEEAVEAVDTIMKAPTTTAKTPTRSSGSNKMPISEIQALLGKDSTVNESTLNSSVNESSFYADEDNISICQSQLDSTIEESFSMDDSTLSNISIVNGKPRKIIKAGRKARKVLGSIQSNENPMNPSTAESTPTRNYKKRTPRSATKNKENQPPKRVKTAKKNVSDENHDELEEQLNKRFQEIENFQLVVE